MALRVLVTGAAGRLGSEVCKALHEAGHDVRGLDRTYRPGMPCRMVVADLLDPLPLYGHMEGCDAVVHLGNHPNVYGGSPPQQIYRENAAMNINVFQAASELGIRRLSYASSVQAFCGHRNGEDAVNQPSCLPYLPLDGNLPTCPGNCYALSKVAGEMQLKYFASLDPQMSCTAMRFPVLVSERHLEYYRHMSGRHRHGRRGYGGNLDEGFAYVVMTDAAAFVLAVLEGQGPGYHCTFPAAPDPALDMPVREIVETYYPNVPRRVPLEELTSLIDLSALKEKLGWEPKRVSVFAEE